VDDRPDIGSLNLRWATALVEGLAGAGVQDAVLSPGSRCTPLTLACEARLSTRVMVDERSAAFCALGLAKATGQPVALVCTSGTAVANWYPAVVEASYGRVPLVLLSADRPPEIQGFGANQTIDQVKLFGGLVRAYHGLPPADRVSFASLGSLAARAVDQSLWPMPGPVHLNVPFREPLVPSRDAAVEPADPGPVARLSRPILLPDPAALSDLADRLSAQRGLIVCGELPPAAGFAEAVAALAAALDCPILADPLSNLRRGPHNRDRILCRYDAWMHKPDLSREARPDWIIRFGNMPVSKALQQYLSSARPPLQVVVDAHGAWPDPQHSATSMVRADPAAFCERLADMAGKPAPHGWRKGFEVLEHRAAELLVGDDDGAPFEWEIIRELLAGMPAEAILFAGNSMPIRDLDTCLGSDPKPLRVLANRGASGIDGNVSTLAGLAAGSRGVVASMIGDLALFHDLNGLHALGGLDAILVVINNGGGGIFRYLPQADLPGFERNWLTPTGLDFTHAARLFGLRYHRVTGRREFAEALSAALAERGPQVIEAMVDPGSSVTAHRAYWAAVAET
jgi:2-succinyl-5-enolpyruvyl-6-hydroxy-3-cyclohexene-1-carboxylate synthase